MKLGVQLYTVRHLLTSSEAISRTMEKLRGIGYTSVQLYGKPELWRACAAAAREAGLEIEGFVIDLPCCLESAEELFALCKEYHIPDIGVSTRWEECLDPAAYAAAVNGFAARAAEQGCSFSYHNHAHEFIRLASGERVMDAFLREFSPAVDFMPDTYWIQQGGYDVRRFLEQTRGRVKLLHLKDMKRTPEGQTFAEVGSGNLYFEGILRTALDCGIQRFIVEQDRCDGDPLESIEKSYRYLNSLWEELQ